MPQSAGDGARFQVASADGSLAFFTDAAGRLLRYDVGSGASTELVSGGVQGVLGASPDGVYLYYLTGSGLFLRHGAATTKVAAAADAANYPPASGAARVSASGTLAFLSTAPLTGYDNTDLSTGEADSEVYLYEPAAPRLLCVSCNPTGGRPSGPSSLPGATANGTGPDALRSYKPGALSAAGDRLFFDSRDGLSAGDIGSSPDVYEWEAQGVGSCGASGGCLAPVSGGGGGSFADASVDGSDAFFLTGRSLVAADPGSVDLYDAREGGGFVEPPAPIACEGDACQILPPEPRDPGLDTLGSGPGNPPIHYSRPHRRRHVRHRRRHRHHHHRRRGRHRNRHGHQRHRRR